MTTLIHMPDPTQTAELSEIAACPMHGLLGYFSTMEEATSVKFTHAMQYHFNP